MARRRTPSLDRRQDRTGIDRSSGIDALHRNNRSASGNCRSPDQTPQPRPGADGLARKSSFANQQAGRISGTIGPWERSVTVRDQSATFRRHPRSGHPRQVTHVCPSFTRLGLPPNCPTAILPPSRRSIGSVDPERAGELSPTHTGTRLAAANRSSRSMARRQSSTPVDSCR